jgi:hypothetical protein
MSGLAVCPSGGCGRLQAQPTPSADIPIASIASVILIFMRFFLRVLAVQITTTIRIIRCKIF